jgi:hypothetical protein
MRARTLALSALLTISAAAASWTQTPAAPAAVVLDMAGDLELRSGGTSRPVDLSKDARLVLHVGDVLTCKNEKSRFTLFVGVEIKVVGAECTPGYRISAATGNYASVVNRYGRLGGRPRGSMLGLLLWPVTGIRTTPATASQLQWRKQSGGTLAATLKEAGSGRVLWTRSGIDAALGALRDADLAAALRAQVDAGKPAPLLDLRISDALNASATITLLDRAAEETLQQALASAGRDLSGDALHLVRADLLLERSLPREALDEYVAMLEGAPESTLLLTKASALAVEISDPRAADLVRRARAAGGS